MTNLVKRFSVLLVLMAFGLVMSACTGSSQKDSKGNIMKNRAEWLKTMNSSVETGDFATVAKLATMMADETRATSESLEDEDASIITSQVGIFAVEVMMYAEAENAESVKDRLGKIKATCDECHQQFR